MPGYQLVDYAEVGLPLWQISVDAISLAHQRLPPISEFVLRSVSHELCEADIGGFLGLQPDVTRGAIAQLIADRLVRPTFDVEGEESCGVTLTEDGEKMLRENGATVPIEEQIPVFFDGLYRRPTIIPPEQIAYPRDVESGRLVELAAMPANKPAVDEISIDELQALLATHAGGRGEFGRDLLKLKRISRYRRLFRLGVALVFKGVKNSRDLRVKFIVGGVRAEDLERRFAEQGGLTRPGFVKSFSDSYLNANLRRHLGQDVAGVVLDAREFEARQRRLSLARLKASGVERKLLMVRDGELSPRDGPSEDEAKRARAELRAANDAMLQPSARPAAV
ncbi:MAG TPA: hypothetical protein VD906_06575, partial [Caulobacteraceae bacterium]|nr:hypothetical protein [Caulobacteraceae bacterium]